MAAFLSTFLPSSSSLLYVRLPHHKPSHFSLSVPFKPRFPSCSLLPPKPPPFSSSSKTPTLLTAITKNLRTLLFILITSILSLSSLRVHPSLASTSPPTQETQETKEQEKIQETKQEQEETDEQVKMYSEILRRDPGDVDALKCVLFIKMRRMEWDGALEYAGRLREAEPEEVEWQLMEALVCELKGDLGEAERLFREILRERPLMVRALHGLALCMHKRLEGPAVFEMLEKALELAISEDRVPEERNIKLLIAQMHVVKGQLDVASEKLQNLINEDPRDFRPHLCQGIVYALLDKKKEADDQFEIYGSLVPDEFPDKGFIDDVILAAKMESEDRLQKDFGSGFFSSKK